MTPAVTRSSRVSLMFALASACASCRIFTEFVRLAVGVLLRLLIQPAGMVLAGVSRFWGSRVVRRAAFCGVGLALGHERPKGVTVDPMTPAVASRPQPTPPQQSGHAPLRQPQDPTGLPDAQLRLERCEVDRWEHRRARRENREMRLDGSGVNRPALSCARAHGQLGPKHPAPDQLVDTLAGSPEAFSGLSECEPVLGVCRHAQHSTRRGDELSSASLQGLHPSYVARAASTGRTIYRPPSTAVTACVGLRLISSTLRKNAPTTRSGS